MIRVIIVEDHKVVADGFERLINDTDIACVIGKAHSAAECWELLSSRQPDVLLLDIGLPDENGILLVPKIKKKYPLIKVLMLSSYSELATITSALDAGADGYVLKSSLSEELLEGIRTVINGERFLCEEVNIALRSNDSNPLELTRREMELLLLITEGYTLTEQADKMCLGYNTVRNYRQKLNVKLGAHNTVQLVQNARALKLV